MSTATHHVYNPTGATVTVGANSVASHTTKVLSLIDADQASFVAAGCTLSQLMPGTADAAHIAGFRHE